MNSAFSLSIWLLSTRSQVCNLNHDVKSHFKTITLMQQKDWSMFKNMNVDPTLCLSLQSHHKVFLEWNTSIMFKNFIQQNLSTYSRASKKTVVFASSVSKDASDILIFTCDSYLWFENNTPEGKWVNGNISREDRTHFYSLISPPVQALSTIFSEEEKASIDLIVAHHPWFTGEWKWICMSVWAWKRGVKGKKFWFLKEKHAVFWCPSKNSLTWLISRWTNFTTWNRP